MSGTKLKLWHVVMQEGTVTFLTRAAMMDFLGPGVAVEATNWAVIVESDVTVAEFNKIARWRHQ